MRCGRRTLPRASEGAFAGSILPTTTTTTTITTATITTTTVVARLQTKSMSSLCAALAVREASQAHSGRLFAVRSQWQARKR